MTQPLPGSAEPPAQAASVAPAAPIWVRHRRPLVVGLLLAMAVLALLGLFGPAVWHRLAGGAPVTEDAAGLGPAERSQIEARIAQRQEALRQHPQDAAGWRALAADQIRLGQLANAAGALRQALKQAPTDPDVLVDLAAVLAADPGATLQAEPARLLEAALAQAPAHPKGLALAGSLAFAQGDNIRAVQFWERALSLQLPNSPAARQLRLVLAEARRAAAEQAAASSTIRTK